MTKTNKYHVKFTHQYQLPQEISVNTISGIQYTTETVDTEWELDAWVDVFTYIYAHYNVIGCVEVIHINTIKELDLAERDIPKRAVMKNYNGNWNWEYECPVCEMLVLGGESYCSSCGQKLDWSHFDE